MSPRTQTAAELLTAKREKMPAELADLHFQLGQDVSWLHIDWIEFKKIFAASDRRVALLNATAGRFFARFERTSWDDTLLHLCRLTDPQKSSGRRNLTIKRLPPLVQSTELRSEVERLVAEVVMNTDFARDWRNRRLAHRDLDRALQPDLHPLAEASREHVEKALASLRSLLNCIELNYENSTTAYDHVIAADNGAEALLYYLSSGLEAEELRRKEDRRWKPVHY